MNAVKMSQTTTTMQDMNKLMSLNDEADDLRQKCLLLTQEIERTHQTCVQLECDNTKLRDEKKTMEEVITKVELNEDSFKEDDEKVKFYTGLTNWNLLMIVVQFVQPVLNVSRSRLSAFQQIIMTLMRLRLGLSG